MDKMDQFVQHIKELWINERRWFHLRMHGTDDTTWGTKPIAKWDGGYGPDGRYYRGSAWEKIAKFCIDNQLDPDTLIKAIFSCKEHCPTPNMAHSSSALSAYRKYCSPERIAAMQAQITTDFETEKQRAVGKVLSYKTYQNVDDTEAWKLTITAPDDLSALFRYCVAHNQGWKEIAKHYKLRALFQYRRYPDLYDDVWGDWIPKTLSKSVKRDWDIEELSDATE